MEPLLHIREVSLRQQQRIEGESAENERRTQANYTGSFHKPEVVMSPLHFQGEFH